ncbi:hypothetical protein [Paraclostridium bifermentans]|uniref:hypothetical protein n=1 Tax=Paraclostridium bifermentans TaxID=1490 RepID=UPI00359C9571
MNNILYINDYMYNLEKQFLEGEDKKYIEVCKNIYGVNIDKISINIWTSHIMDEFRENIIKNCKDVNNIEEISKEIYNTLKKDRKKIILYAYLKGHICGYNDYKLIIDFKYKYKIKSINNSEKYLLKYDEFEEFLDFIKNNKSEDFNSDIMLKNINNYYIENIKKDILTINIDFDKERLINIVEETIIKEVIKKYNEGILYGILYKINKKALKINKMGL